MKAGDTKRLREAQIELAAEVRNRLNELQQRRARMEARLHGQALESHDARRLVEGALLLLLREPGSMYRGMRPEGSRL
jgi:hypothetical protein